MTINVNNTALLVVDIQGTLARTVHHVNQLQQNWLKMIRVARLFELPILVLEQYPEGLGGTIQELKVELGDSRVFVKRTFSGYQEPRFRQALQALEINNLLVMGIETHVCVFQTSLDILTHEDLSLYLLVDAMSSRTALDHEFAIKRLEKQGAIITTVEMTAFELMQDSRHETFKDFLEIIK